VPHAIAKMGVRWKRRVRLPSDEATFASRDNQQTAVRQPVHAKGKWERGAHHNLGSPVLRKGQDLLCTPVANPKTAVAPARRFTHRKPRKKRRDVRPKRFVGGHLMCSAAFFDPKSTASLSPRQDPQTRLSVETMATLLIIPQLCFHVSNNRKGNIGHQLEHTKWSRMPA